MFKKSKTNTPMRVERMSLSTKLHSAKAQDKPIEFAVVPLERIVAPEKTLTTDTSDLQKRSFVAKTKLSDISKQLLSKLAPQLAAPVLSKQFPSVMNRIALSWGVPNDIYPLLDSFLVDDRGNRQGFPFEALQELSALLEHHELFVSPRRLGSYNSKAPRAY